MEHRKVLGILNLVYGGLGALGGLLALAVLGGAAGIVEIATRESEDAWIAVPLLRLLATLLFLLALALSLPSLIAGFGLAAGRRWGTAWGIVVSALHLVNVPFGTLLGVYGLWVLLPRSGGKAG
jgi:hypothetical protein